MADGMCPCGNGRRLDDCCGPHVWEQSAPATAEALMRSRYTAYVLQNIDYLKATLWPKHQDGFDAAGTAKWAAENHWMGLAVLEVEKGGAADREGFVLFEAKYLSGGVLKVHREKSRFRRKAGRWYYIEAL